MFTMLRKAKRKIVGAWRKLRLKTASGGKFTTGENFFCHTGCSVSRKNSITIGSHFFMGKDCHFGANANIGNDVMFASRVALVGGDHVFDKISVPMRLSGRDVFETIEIEDDIWVGYGAIIMQGVRLGSGCVVAAGSVVTKDVEANAIVGGNPARFIRYREQ